MIKFSGYFNQEGHDAALANIIATYHVVEKGLTMPNRRFVFGRSVVCKLMEQIECFEKHFGAFDEQVVHAADVVTDYYDIHSELEHEKNEAILDDVLKAKLSAFCKRHQNPDRIRQVQTTKESFYKEREAAFGRFAWMRHTLRHYASKPLTEERIGKAVALALSTPSACNRQYCRVHLISNQKEIKAVLEIQKGNRGFGHLANKLLVITADLEGLIDAKERNDLFTNGGMFLMNLCYSLFYHEIAHCVLNWSKSPEEDIAFRKIVRIKESENIIALLACGETPDVFYVAASPRKSLKDVLVIH
jgi:hypothetical protein